MFIPAALAMSNCVYTPFDDLMFNTGGSPTGLGKAVCTTEACSLFTSANECPTGIGMPCKWRTPCANDDCDNVCVEVCSLFTSANECPGGKGWGCMWSDNVCVEACATFTSETECPTGRCMWDAVGVPWDAMWGKAMAGNVCLEVSQTVRFGGNATGEHGHRFEPTTWMVDKYRPYSTKFIQCTLPERCPSDTACGCESCPSATACGWTAGTDLHKGALRVRLVGETFGESRERMDVADGVSDLQIPENDEYFHVAEFWGDCAAGHRATWVASTYPDVDADTYPHPLYNNREIEFYAAEQAGVMIGSRQKAWCSEGGRFPGATCIWTVHVTSVGSTRVKLVIKAKDSTKGVKLKLTTVMHNVPTSVTHCMDVKMCLNAINGSSLEGSQLRTDNRQQLQCLRLAISEGGRACKKWKQCLHQYPQAQSDPWNHTAMLKAILEAAVGSPALVESQRTPDSESSNELNGTCAHPGNDDPESWDCECGGDLQLACSAHPDLAECIREKMCASNEVCCSWKRDHCAPDPCNNNTLIQATPTLAETLEGRRRPLGNISSASAVLLEETMGGKVCTLR